MISNLFYFSKEYKKTIEAMREGDFPIANFGFNEDAFILISMAITEETGSSILLFENDFMAKKAYDKIREVHKNCGLLRTRDISFFNAYSKTSQTEHERLESIYSAIELEEYILVTSISAVMNSMVEPKKFSSLQFEIKKGDEYDFNELTGSFISLGFDRVDIVESKGQFSVKGGIIDVFPLMYEKPIRLDFFGDEVYEIKAFDIDTQLSSEDFESIKIRACEENFEDFVLSDSNIKFSIFDYIPNFNILSYSFSRQIKRLEEIYDDFVMRLNEDVLEDRAKPEYINYLLCRDELLRTILNRKLMVFSGLKTVIKGLNPNIYTDYSIMDVPMYFSDFNRFSEDVKNYTSNNYAIVIAYSSEFQKNKLLELFDENEISYNDSDDINILKQKDIFSRITLVNIPLLNGYMSMASKFILITPAELFQKKAVKKHKKSDKRKKIKAFTEIEVGDYVVHESYGIGRYAGIFLKNVDDEEKDMIRIEYKGDEVLFIPVEHLENLHKYLGKDSKKVELHSLSSKKWQNQKSRAKKNVDEVADELVELYAKRMEIKGHAFPEDDVWQNEFEETFPFNETPGQIQATQEIKEDMQKSYPMERLLCGDVGYGKTEVALRAIFKCISNGKQACVLVPTTVLAEQHYISMSSRLALYPLQVDVISRFKTKSEQKKVLDNLKSGVTDLLIGTHRLLSKDVTFKDLGLLVVDEEQRFGVSHKEKIKSLKSNIDSLSMTATPIPRTLNMSLMGVKDLSVIEDPPEDRFPIQTYVLEFDEKILKEAINREIARGGQIYYVHNRVADLPSIKRKIEEILPNINCRIAHGQMSERQLEDVIIDFMNGDFDVLISTTIIETGLDISNVNTIIIDDCDRYGLSQLYQLRGRVGRSNRMAYAYLFYGKNKVLTEISEKRLKAIKEFSSLGAGFKLSMRDLELRGSGNIFGKAQSGHISEIGYEMYSKMLEEAIDRLKGKKQRKLSECKVEFTCSAYVSEKYIENYRFRLEIYKRISAIENEEDRRELVNEMSDRFGNVPIEASQLTYIALIRKMGEFCGFDLIVQEGKQIKIYFAKEKDLDLKLVYDILSQVDEDEVRFVGDTNAYFCLSYDSEDLIEIDLMENVLNFLDIVRTCVNE